jgi:hypothetical protein
MTNIEQQILKLQQIKPYNSTGFITITSYRKWEAAQKKLKQLQEKVTKKVV